MCGKVKLKLTKSALKQISLCKVRIEIISPITLRKSTITQLLVCFVASQLDFLPVPLQRFVWMVSQSENKTNFVWAPPLSWSMSPHTPSSHLYLWSLHKPKLIIDKIMDPAIFGPGHPPWSILEFYILLEFLPYLLTHQLLLLLLHFSSGRNSILLWLPGLHISCSWHYCLPCNC